MSRRRDNSHLANARSVVYCLLVETAYGWALAPTHRALRRVGA